MNKQWYKNCCVFGCMNTSVTKPGISYFKLPPNEARRSEWLKIIKREDLEGKPAHHCRVCEMHFDSKDILPSQNRKILKKGSYPRRMLPEREFNDAECQVDTRVEMKSKYVQCETTDKPTMLAQVQTPAHLLKDLYKKRKQDYDYDNCSCNKKPKMTTTISELSLFLDLCDKFLSKKFADLVKEKTRLKLNPPATSTQATTSMKGEPSDAARDISML